MNDNGNLIGTPVDATPGREHHLAPARAKKGGRDALGQDRAAVLVHAPQHLDRAEQRVAGTSGVERERSQEGRCELADRGVALDHLVQTVVGGSGQLLGIANAAFELLPSDAVGDRAQRVAAARARFHQQATEPRVDASGVFEQPGGPKQSFGAHPVRPPKQRADQLLDHDQSGVS